MTDSELASTCQGVARCLTYNGEVHEAKAKHLLLECASRLDAYSVRVTKKKDGYLFSNARGKCRYLSFKETVLYKLFNVLPQKV